MLVWFFPHNGRFRINIPSRQSFGQSHLLINRREAVPRTRSLVKSFLLFLLLFVKPCMPILTAKTEKPDDGHKLHSRSVYRQSRTLLDDTSSIITKHSQQNKRNRASQNKQTANQQNHLNIFDNNSHQHHHATSKQYLRP